jgi:hypothetical protein
VFAIAITLLILEIAVPAGSEDDLLGALGDLWPSYLAYFVSFATTGAVWFGHTVITEYLHHADSVLLRLNLLLTMIMVSVLAVRRPRTARATGPGRRRREDPNQTTHAHARRLRRGDRGRTVPACRGGHRVPRARPVDPRPLQHVPALSAPDLTPDHSPRHARISAVPCFHCRRQMTALRGLAALMRRADPKHSRRGFGPAGRHVTGPMDSAKCGDNALGETQPGLPANVPRRLAFATVMPLRPTLNGRVGAPGARS